MVQRITLVCLAVFVVVGFVTAPEPTSTCIPQSILDEYQGVIEDKLCNIFELLMGDDDEPPGKGSKNSSKGKDSPGTKSKGTDSKGKKKKKKRRYTE